MNWDTPWTPWQGIEYLLGVGVVMLILALWALWSVSKNKRHDSASHSD